MVNQEIEHVYRKWQQDLYIVHDGANILYLFAITYTLAETNIDSPPKVMIEFKLNSSSSVRYSIPSTTRFEFWMYIHRIVHSSVIVRITESIGERIVERLVTFPPSSDSVHKLSPPFSS